MTCWRCRKSAGEAEQRAAEGATQVVPGGDVGAAQVDRRRGAAAAV